MPFDPASSGPTLSGPACHPSAKLPVNLAVYIQQGLTISMPPPDPRQANRSVLLLPWSAIRRVSPSLLPAESATRTVLLPQQEPQLAFWTAMSRHWNCARASELLVFYWGSFVVGSGDWFRELQLIALIRSALFSSVAELQSVLDC